jgi:lipopolysaccharide export system permease protein
MRVLDRYIIKAVGLSSAMVMAVLMALLALFLFISEQGDVGTGNYGNLQVLRFVALQLPRELFQFLPIAALMGSLLGMGTLARGSELTVMRAAGVSILRIGRSLAAAGLLLMIGAIALGEFMAPPLAQSAREYKAYDRYANISFERRGGIWVRDGNLILKAEQQSRAGALGGITVFNIAADNRLAAVGRAVTAAQRSDGGWDLTKYAESGFGAARIAATAETSHQLNTRVSAAFLAIAAAEPGDLSLRELAGSISYLESNGQETRRYRFAFWSGVARIVAIPLAALLALPFLFGSQRTSGNSARAALGLVLGLAYFIVQRVIESGTIAFELNPVLLAWFPTVLLAGVVTVLVLRLRT